MQFEVKPYDLDMARLVFEDIRPADLHELREMNMTSADQFETRHERYVALFEGEPFACFGLQLLNFTAHTWLWGNSRLTRYLPYVTKVCRDLILPAWADTYWDRQIQIVGNPQHSGWFARLGFYPTPHRYKSLQIFVYGPRP